MLTKELLKRFSSHELNFVTSFDFITYSNERSMRINILHLCILLVIINRFDVFYVFLYGVLRLVCDTNYNFFLYRWCDKFARSLCSVIRELSVIIHITHTKEMPIIAFRHSYSVSSLKICIKKYRRYVKKCVNILLGGGK